MSCPHTTNPILAEIQVNEQPQSESKRVFVWFGSGFVFCITEVYVFGFVFCISPEVHVFGFVFCITEAHAFG